jgi:hypothetical protein
MDVETRSGGSRRVVIWVVAAVLVVGAIIAIGKLRDGDAGTSTDTASETVVPDSAETTASTLTTAATTTIAPTTTPTTTTPATSATSPTPGPIFATVDLRSAVETLEPEQIATYPIAPPGDLFPTAYATTAPGNRIAILDDVTGVVRFIDGTTRTDIAEYPTSIPTIGSQAFVAGYFFVGPDDVFYVNESGADGLPSIVAYARSGDSYSEVARTFHGVGDSILTLDRSGVSVFGETKPIMPYVGVDGQPSGATLDADQLTITSEIKDVYTIHRSGHTWSVTYVIPADAGLPDSDTCVLCPSAFLGPNGTVVLVNRSPTTDGDLQTKLTVLSDTVVTYDIDWEYIGTLDGKMLFDRLDQDSIDIGTVEI